MAHFYAPSEMKKKTICTTQRIVHRQTHMYNSIMQKIARNLHKPHSSIITIVLLVKEIIITIKIRICRMWFFVFKIFLIIFKCTSIKILF